jgi:hypothetical protein
MDRAVKGSLFLLPVVALGSKERFVVVVVIVIAVVGRRL